MATTLGAQLPEGFVLDQPQGNLPPGFVLDDQTSQPVPRMTTDPIAALQRSGGQFVKDVTGALKDPVGTAKALGGLGLGAAQKLIPGEQAQEPIVDSLADFYVQRYGSVEQALDTLNTDPVGFASDVSMFLTGGGGAVAAAGKAGKLGKVAKAGQAISRAGAAIDPLTVATKAAGSGLRAATKGRKVSPFASKVDNPVVEAAKRLDVDVPASVQTKAGAPAFIEAQVVKGPFGGKLAQKVENAKQALVQAGEDIVKGTNASDDLLQAGEAVVKGAEKFRKRFFDIKDALYRKANFDGRAANIAVNTEDAVKILDDILKQKESAKKILPESLVQGRKALAEIRDNLSSGNVKATNVNDAITQLNNNFSFSNPNPVVTGNEAQLRKLAATLSDELDKAIVAADPSLANDIERANRFYRLSLNEINSHFGKQILKYSDQPDKILPMILKNTTSIDDVKRIYRLVGQENKRGIQASFLREFLEGAKNEAGVFKPQSLSRQIKRFGEAKLQKVLDADQYQKLKDIAEVSKGFSRFEKVASGSQTQFGNRLLAEMILVITNPNLGIPVLLGDMGGAAAVSSGAGQAILGAGLDLTEGGRMAGDAITGSANRIGGAGRILRASQLSDQSESPRGRVIPRR